MIYKCSNTTLVETRCKTSKQSRWLRSFHQEQQQDRRKPSRSLLEAPSWSNSSPHWIFVSINCSHTLRKNLYNSHSGLLETQPLVKPLGLIIPNLYMSQRPVYPDPRGGNGKLSTGIGLFIGRDGWRRGSGVDSSVHC